MPRPCVLPQFIHASAKEALVTHVAGSQPLNPANQPRSGQWISNTTEPFSQLVGLVDIVHEPYPKGYIPGGSRALIEPVVPGACTTNMPRVRVETNAAVGTWLTGQATPPLAHPESKDVAGRCRKVAKPANRRARGTTAVSVRLPPDTLELWNTTGPGRPMRTPEDLGRVFGRRST